jgi:predicted enzyme related to lactoylglutathione lyase
MHQVIHFELGTVEPERAAGFYSKVFGRKITKWNGPEEYWLVETGPQDKPGINGGLLRHQDAQPRTVNTIAVPSVDDFAEKVAANGGKVVEPKMTIPGVGYLAYCLDTEGNLFGIHQEDPSAK